MNDKIEKPEKSIQKQDADIETKKINRREAIKNIAKTIAVAGACTIPFLFTQRESEAGNKQFAQNSNYCNYANYSDYAAYGNYYNVANYANYYNVGKGLYLNYANYTNYRDYINYRNYGDYANKCR